MLSDSDFQAQLQSCTDEDLLQMVKEKTTYTPEAIEYVKKELTKRGRSNDLDMIASAQLETETIHVTRRACYLAKPRKFVVLVDGIKKGSVKNGETITIKVASGKREFVVQMGSCKSEQYVVDTANPADHELTAILYVRGRTHISIVSAKEKSESTIRHYGWGWFVVSLIFGWFFVTGLVVYLGCRNDLQLMEEGYMDDSGKTLTKVASYIGLFLFCLNVLSFLIIFTTLLSLS